MSYDLVNRRDTLTGHHASVKGVNDTIKAYLDMGIPAEKLNLGFPFYAKWFTASENCTAIGKVPTNCHLEAGEKANGTDAGTSGVMTFETSNLATAPALASMTIDTTGQGRCGYEADSFCNDGNCCSSNMFW